MIRTIKTPLGNELVVTEAPDHFEDGVQLVLKIYDPLVDSRQLHILLDQDTLHKLQETLAEFEK